MSTPPAYDAAEGAATGAAGALAGVGPGAAAATPVDNVRISVPSETLSPTFTFSSAIVPPTGDGTSIVALSDSSVINASSGFTASPLFTCTSITGTSLKSPMSGTRTSTGSDTIYSSSFPSPAPAAGRRPDSLTFSWSAT